MSTQTELAWIPTDETFGARLALIRQGKGWNSKEAALACGVPPGSWREWEVYGRLPRELQKAVEKISARTGVDEYWLLTGKKNPRPGDPDGGATLPRLDSNQQPSGYASAQVIEGPWGSRSAVAA